MKRILAIASVGLCLCAGAAAAQVAGRSILGITVAEMEALITGWSAKKDLLGKTVVNDAKDKVGTIDDIIVTPDNAASYAIISVGGFVGIGKSDVAIPMKQIKLRDGNLVLPGATKEAVKALPKFEYAPRK
ncbi:MAG: PRC-barrel domain-containing protein [Noviherbaspirillum sp.]